MLEARECQVQGTFANDRILHRLPCYRTADLQHEFRRQAQNIPQALTDKLPGLHQAQRYRQRHGSLLSHCSTMGPRH